MKEIHVAIFVLNYGHFVEMEKEMRTAYFQKISCAFQV